MLSSNLLGRIIIDAIWELTGKNAYVNIADSTEVPHRLIYILISIENKDFEFQFLDVDFSLEKANLKLIMDS